MNLNVNTIFNLVLEKYQSIDTYYSEITTIWDIDKGKNNISQFKSSCYLKMKKPNLYLVVWGQKSWLALPDGAVWHNGKKSYLYHQSHNAYEEINDFEIALALAFSSSNWVSYNIPFLFLSGLKTFDSTIARLKRFNLEKFRINDQNGFYVIFGESNISKMEIFWISKKDFLISRYLRSFNWGKDNEKEPFPKLTDQYLEYALKATGRKISDKKKKSMSMFLTGNVFWVYRRLNGTLTEIHENINMPKLEKDDFNFKVPTRSVQKN